MLQYDPDDGDSTSEATFGVQKFETEPEDKSKLDYYAVAH